YAYDYGTSVTVSPSVGTGSGFTGWSGGCSGTGACVLTMMANTTVTATFTGPQTLAVTRAGTGSGTVSSSPAGINCATPCGATFNYGMMVKLSVTASISSTFTGWTGDCTGSSTTCSVPITQARNVTATFTINPEVLSVVRVGNGTVSSSPSGISCGSACS